MHLRLACLMAMALIVGGPAAAKDDHDRARRAVEEGRMLPLRDILARAEADYPGQVVETELEDKGGVPVYEIKIVTRAGRLMKLHYDARTGALLRSSGRDAPR
jgi:uncharacterized membrane protein YkoI